MQLMFIPTLLKEKINLDDNFQIKIDRNIQTALTKNEYNLLAKLNNVILNLLLNRIVTSDVLHFDTRSDVSKSLRDYINITNNDSEVLDINLELFKSELSDEIDGIELVKLRDSILVFLDNAYTYNLLVNTVNVKDKFLGSFYKMILKGIDSNDNFNILKLREVMVYCFSAWYRNYEIK